MGLIFIALFAVCLLQPGDTAILTCTCTETTICDVCASQQIEMEQAGSVELQPGMLTATEREELLSAVGDMRGLLSIRLGGQL